ncbi:MAG: carboxymuconolactone decarboxylase family protein [Ilumatobacteraceae bacterium]
MARLPPLTRSELDPDQLQLWDALTENRGGGVELVDEHGGLVGPFNSWLYVPKIGRRLSSLGAHLRFGTSIPRHLAEIAICTVGAHWRSEFEFWAHAPMAIDHGVEPAVIEALRSGADPVFDTDEERLVHQVATQLLNDRRVDDATYAGTRTLLGEAGMVELVALIGYYCLISMLLNLFEVPLPAGEVPSWPDDTTTTAG